MKRMPGLLMTVFLVLLASAGVLAAEWSEPVAWEHNVEGVDRMPWLVGNTLYFARDYDIYFSEYDEMLGTWSEPEPVPGPINTGANEINPCVVQDGKVLWFARYDPISDYQYFRSQWDEEKGEWGEPEEITEICTDTQEWDIWVAEDESVLYLTTKGAFGDTEPLGGRDIWKSTWDGEKWTTPVNLGGPVNSEGNEWSIFIGPEGELYIDSNRDGGEGGYDIWKAADDTSDPVNLGAPFNSAASERSIAFNDKFFFFSAFKREGGPGHYDLFYCVKE